MGLCPCLPSACPVHGVDATALEALHSAFLHLGEMGEMLVDLKKKMPEGLAICFPIHEQNPEMEVCTCMYHFIIHFNRIFHLKPTILGIPVSIPPTNSLTVEVVEASSPYKWHGGQCCGGTV